VRQAQRSAALVGLAPHRHVVVAPETTTADAVAVAEAAGAALIVVLGDGGILDAAVTVAAAAAADRSATVLAAADLDPPTTRPDVTATALLERLRDEQLPWVAVTTAAGRFVGAVDADALADLASRDELP
jgi:CBS domain-containing protein